MANAKKCDRCQKLYDPFSQGERFMCRFENPTFLTGAGMREGTVFKRLVDHAGAKDLLDLCPECSEDFILFMEGNPLSVRTDICEENVSRANSKDPIKEYIYTLKSGMPYSVSLTAEEMYEIIDNEIRFR